MVKAINIRSSVVKIPFVDENEEVQLELSFDKKDITEQKIIDLQNLMLKNVALMSNDEKMNDYDQVKLVMATVIDEIFGEGSFNKLYELTPSMTTVILYFLELIEVVKNETQLEFDELQTAFKKYKK